MAPRITAIIGSYNSAATLERAIDSILAQTVSELELIVIDDGSSDASPAIASAASARDGRVRAIALPRNVGISGSLNSAIAEAASPIVAIQDADDHSEPTRLERELAVLDANPDVAVVGCRMREVDELGRELRPRTKFLAGDVRGALMHFNPIPNTSAAFRRAAALEAGGYEARYRYAMEYDLWLRLSEHHRILALDEVLATRTMSSENVAATHEREQIAETITIRARTLARRRTLRGAGGLLAPAISYLTPLAAKRARRRRLGQAP